MIRGILPMSERSQVMGVALGGRPVGCGSSARTTLPCSQVKPCCAGGILEQPKLRSRRLELFGQASDYMTEKPIQIQLLDK
jgi:hypothetical protein